jgi:hypothetical protein
MTTFLTLRADVFKHAIESLPALHIAVLGRILVEADPTTGRLFGMSRRLSESFHLSEALTRHALRGLEDAQVLSVREDRHGVCVIELGAIFVRAANPPPNLPVAPPV